MKKLYEYTTKEGIELDDDNICKRTGFFYFIVLDTINTCPPFKNEDGKLKPHPAHPDAEKGTLYRLNSMPDGRRKEALLDQLSKW